jgi:hypothetical protein
MSSENLESETEWEIWYQDTFDRECPRQVEIAGQRLVEGLIQLWARHLFETVQPDGQRGFSRFNLWWKQERKSITIVGTWEGQVRMRGWVYGDERGTSRGYMAEGDRALLHKVATTHQDYILRGGTSEAILATAKASENRQDFEEQLSSLA